MNKTSSLSDEIKKIVDAMVARLSRVFIGDFVLIYFRCHLQLNTYRVEK